MKRYRFSLSLLILFLIIGISLISIDVKADSDLIYTFQNDVLYSQDNSTFYNEFNVRDFAIYNDTQERKATFNFSTEVDGTTSDDIEFIDLDNSGTGCVPIIVNGHQGYSKVLKLYEGSEGNARFNFQDNFTSQSNGTIEFWALITNAEGTCVWELKNNDTILLSLKISVDKFYYWDGSWNLGSPTIPLDNYWYPIRIDYECTEGGYQGLAQYEWKVYVLDILQGTYDFGNDELEANNFGFNTPVASGGYTIYMDAIGYTPLDPNYNIRDNYDSLLILDDWGTEPDRWEFSFASLYQRHANGVDNPNGWTDLEDGEDDVNVLQYDSLDSVIEMYANSGETLGLYKDDFSYTTDISLNVTFGFEIKYIYSILNNDVYLRVYSSDNTEIVRIRINNDGTLKYWTTGSTYIQLDTGFVIDTDYSINLGIDYDTDICTLRYSTEGVHTDSFEFPLATSTKTGLKKVSYDICADTDYVHVYLDYIGVYVNERSITDDFASVGLHVSDHTYWYFEQFNLLTVDIIGEGISIYLDVADYVSTPAPGFEHELIIASDDYDGTPKTFNLYDLLFDDYWGYSYIWGGVLWFHFYDTLEFYEMAIEGVRLLEGSNEYSLEFESSGVNVTDNYFQAINGELQFIQISDDNNLEYIQATFNIDDLPSVNRSISYEAGLNGNADGHFRINYEDYTSTLVPLRTYTSAPNVVLPQDKNIVSFIVLITDNDNDAIQGTTTGYIENIKLIFLPDVSLVIITLALLSVIIPLLIMIVPTFLIYNRFGKGVIVPIFLLMTFICFITDLIPIWLFFIIIFSCGGFMFMQKRMIRDDE